MAGEDTPVDAKRGRVVLRGRRAVSQYNVSEVPQLIAPGEAARLHKVGAHSTEDVLRRGATARGRRRLARAAGLPLAAIETLARRADLLRLADVGPEHVLLLEAAGVKSVPDLAARDPSALAHALAVGHHQKKLPIPVPSEAQVRVWIRSARELPPILDPGPR
jgi:hypothetical protein